MQKDLKSLIARMTLEEKAGLLSGSDFWHTKAVERLGIPAVMVSDGPHGLRKQDQEGDHLGINDSIKAVCFPAACATAASFDRELMDRIGKAIGDSCQHEGVSTVLGPAVNIKRSPLCGRNFEYVSEDPYLAGQMAAAYIKGVQSRNVGTSIKHFALNSQEHRRMSSSSDADERTMREIYLPAFETAVREAKPWTVMCSYNRINGTFASEDKWLLTDLLRNEWGFDGLVMSDWGAVSDRVRGVAAGLDLEMPASGGLNDAKIVAAVREGKLDEKLVDLCCERVLELVYRFTQTAKPGTPWDLEAQHALAAECAADCMVLLKNENDALPLQKEAKTAFIGEFAKKPRYQGGGSSHINSFRTTGALQAAESLNVEYARGYSIKEDGQDTDLLKEATALAARCSAAVIFAGLPDSYESEGYDRSHMRLPENQDRLIAAVAAVNPRTVVVLHNGSPVEMPWIGQVQAVLEAYLGGQAVGEAAVRVLYGDVNPSGHLAETFPLKLSDNPSYPWYGGEGNHTQYREGIFVGYRWYDKKEAEVLFPFGHGLSYTTFDYTDLRLSADSIRDTETADVTVTVTNTGSRPGKAVVQLYIAPPADSAYIRPVRELKGFDKVYLRPGESRQVSFTLDQRSFALWNEQIHDWYAESGVYSVQAGASSRDIRLSADLRVECTRRLPRPRYDENSIMMDLMADPRARQIIKSYLAALQPPTATGEQGEERSDAARDAITDEMNEAMERYVPLRTMVGFSGDPRIADAVQEILKKLNEEE